MRMRLFRVLMVAALLAVSAATAAAQGKDAPEPDSRTMRWVQRAIAWYPNSEFRLLENTRYQTPSGPYRMVVVERTCASQLLTGKPSLLVDEGAGTVWLGSIGELPNMGGGQDAAALRTFLSGFLPDAMKSSMNLRVKLEWDVGPRRPGAVIPVNMLVETGYGEYRKPAGVTADGKFLVIGSEMPLDEDPVAYRRRILAESDLVMWDTSDGQDSAVEIVEVSDPECPACKNKWQLIAKVLETSGEDVRHGMVSFPMTTFHPWAFRASCASWCVAQQKPQALIGLKETFYDLQKDMEVALVTPTAVDFVSGQGLDEAVFRSCYLRDESIGAVLRQLSLASFMSVQATPTFVVNGWMIQVPSDAWFPDLVKRLIEGQEP